MSVKGINVTVTPKRMEPVKISYVQIRQNFYTKAFVSV